MTYQLSFSEALNYDAGQLGITVRATLSIDQSWVECAAKLDTGASLCVFAREYGERLGLDVSDGIRQFVGTVTGSFVVYLHEVNLSVAGMEFDALVGFAEDEAFAAACSGGKDF